jgi:multimeric flavodoxin WrbA
LSACGLQAARRRRASLLFSLPVAVSPVESRKNGSENPSFKKIQKTGGNRMKIICLLGSPRTKGNSAALAKRFCDTAGKLGAQIQTFELNKLNYRDCQACMACKTKLDKCVLQDDLAGVLDSIRDADVLVMTTPIYYGDVTGPVKAFIDRTYSYLVPNYPSQPKPSRLSPGKKLVFIQTQTQPDENLYADVFTRNEKFFKRYGFTETHLIRIGGVRNPGDVEARKEAMALAEETAKKVMA